MNAPGDKASRIGPFQTEQQARQSPAVQAAYAAFDRNPGAGKMHPHNLAILTDALAAAEVTPGEYDRRIVSWLAGWEPTTAVVVAGIIRRAADGPGELPWDDESADRANVLSALAFTAGALRDQVTECPDCDFGPESPLCPACTGRLAHADELDELAAKLGGGS